MSTVKLMSKQISHSLSNEDKSLLNIMLDELILNIVCIISNYTDINCNIITLTLIDD